MGRERSWPISVNKCPLPGNRQVDPYVRDEREAEQPLLATADRLLLS
jgi:hypothetical protein